MEKRKLYRPGLHPGQFDLLSFARQARWQFTESGRRQNMLPSNVNHDRLARRLVPSTIKLHDVTAAFRGFVR